jgi:polyphosphate glucokinase
VSDTPGHDPNGAGPAVVLGIDIGGSAVKGALVEVATGRLAGARHEVVTPTPATPDVLGAAVAEVVRLAGWSGPVGCAFPGVVKDGRTLTAANLHPAWEGLDAVTALSGRTGCPVVVMNDADAAGLAEVRLGAGAGQGGVVLLLTLGTGIGSALFCDGRLVPNTELGQLPMRGRPAEHLASARVRRERGLDWPAYAALVDEYLAVVETVLWPDLLVIGGGVSAEADRWFHLLHTRTPVVPARLANDAGIVGAALWAAEAGPGARTPWQADTPTGAGS